VHVTSHQPVEPSTPKLGVVEGLKALAGVRFTQGLGTRGKLSQQHNCWQLKITSAIPASDEQNGNLPRTVQPNRSTLRAQY
jgi:hypothetical protein